MLMTYYALRQVRKRILVLRGLETLGQIRSVRKIRNSGKIFGLSRLQHSRKKTDFTQFFNLA
jgi:hypothetical protein